MTSSRGYGHKSKAHGGIVGDKDTSVRDEALALWGTERPAIMFGDPLIPPPAGTVQVLIYAKPFDSGIKGARAGFRRDAEVIYLIGPWPVAVGGRSSVLRTGATVAGARGLSVRYGHPHAKPVDLLQQLIAACPQGVIADPFAGSGSTLEAARLSGRRAIGVEVHKPYFDQAVRRLVQAPLEIA